MSRIETSSFAVLRVALVLTAVLFSGAPPRAAEWSERMQTGERAAHDGLLTEAESAFREAFVVAEEGGKPIEIARTLESLADLLATQGRHDEAESLYLECIRRWEGILGTKQPRLGIPLHNLAVVYLRECRVDDALPLIERVSDLWGDTLKSDHPDRVTALRSEAALLRRCGRDEVAGLLDEMLTR